MSAESAEQKAVLGRQFHLTEVPIKVCTMETFYKNKVPTLIPFMQFRFNSDTPAFVQAACVRNQGDTRTIQYIIKGLLTHEETFAKKNGARTVIEIKQDAKKTVEKKGDGAIVRMTEELKNQVINAEVVEGKQKAVEWQKGAVEWQKGAVEWQKEAVEKVKEAVLG